MKVSGAELVVEMRGITKKFGSFVANDNISLNVHKGEVHALLGENGAGKTTLMNQLYGLYQPTSGEIYLNGKKVNITDPNVAIAEGIGMVHQHFMLIQPFTVAENIILGNEITNKMGELDYKKAVNQVKELSKKYGLDVDPDAIISDISVGMQQRVEILKVLYRGAEILIFDEPTAVLTPQEIEEFIEIIKKFTQDGKTVIIITHKLKEILKMADTCTIIRRGVKIGVVDVSKTTEAELAEMMVGRSVTFSVEKEDKVPGKSVLDVKDLCVKDSRNVQIINKLSLNVRKGEILGIAGVDGNGQNELVETILGLRKVESGSICINERNITNKKNWEILQSGIGSIPADRQKHGIVPNFSIPDNLILERYNVGPFSRHGILNRKAIKDNAAVLIDRFDIRASSPEAKVNTLSGGNQQKVIIGREISNNPDLLIASQPTRGLDVGAIEFIHKAIVEQRNNNKAVLLISFELDEILDLSDRIAVMYEGRIVKILNSKETDEKEIGLLMAGGQSK